MTSNMDRLRGRRFDPPEANEEFTFFFSHRSPFSQWYPAPFTGPDLFSDRKEEHTFAHAEQWMMYQKALLMGDTRMANKILSTDSPKLCKALGRKVKNFDSQLWDSHKLEIVKEGNRRKFGQNPALASELKRTAGTTLVEASPWDRVWGIGLRASDPRSKSRSTWLGTNLLGQALTEIREEFRWTE